MPNTRCEITDADERLIVDRRAMVAAAIRNPMMGNDPARELQIAGALQHQSDEPVRRISSPPAPRAAAAFVHAHLLEIEPCSSVQCTSNHDRNAVVVPIVENDSIHLVSKVAETEGTQPHHVDGARISGATARLARLLRTCRAMPRSGRARRVHHSVLRRACRGKTQTTPSRPIQPEHAKS